MLPPIVYLEPFAVVGVFCDLTPATMHTLPEVWDEYGRRRGEIPAPDGAVLYGVGCALEGFYRYTAGRPTRSAHVPVGMLRVEVPGGAYARFTHRGPVSTFGQTVQRAFGAWLPAAQLVRRPGPELERYDARFRGEEEDSEVDFLVPVVDPRAALLAAAEEAGGDEGLG